MYLLLILRVLHALTHCFLQNGRGCGNVGLFSSSLAGQLHHLHPFDPYLVQGALGHDPIGVSEPEWEHSGNRTGLYQGARFLSSHCVLVNFLMLT